MSRGKEFLHRVHEVLGEFEAAVRRERGLFGRSVARRQDVDIARQKVIETIVQVVKEAQEAYPKQ
jgi:hypothetical protein